MSSLHPEKDDTGSALKSLRSALTRIDPVEHSPFCHLSMSGDEEVDKALLAQGYKFDDERVVSHFEELATSFDEDYRLSSTFLAELWDIDQSKVPYPADESQTAACYYTQLRQEEFMVTITHWMQPNPKSGEMEEMMGACIDPTWSLSPTVRVVYINKSPLLSCKYSGFEVADPGQAEWSDTGTLSVDDIVAAEKVIKRIPFRVFD